MLISKNAIFDEMNLDKIVCHHHRGISGQQGRLSVAKEMKIKRAEVWTIRRMKKCLKKWFLTAVITHDFCTLHQFSSEFQLLTHFMHSKTVYMIESSVEKFNQITNCDYIF